ncbi:diphthamide biosynthesis protein 2 [Hyaloscypha variabilis]|uniref:2-(3-amino-3-carboxypropyl)histidine synthase subunit 2 n=1 Tax=Hyaloscypha variabilis (strain UAMH 11265 / GT02V1 / F) TaxID=1149755 RepID=A0A2J6R5M2_HYAVF|nr:diphthamide biosynthesis protein 2 [Hyaloscypha variabilis F]
MTDSIPLTAPPVLSTPETHIFEDPTPVPVVQNTPRLTNEELWEIYEIARTAGELRHGGYKRVALQFPDGMLRDAPRVFEALEEELKRLPGRAVEVKQTDDLATSFNHLSTTSFSEQGNGTVKGEEGTAERVRLYILADTSYGSCCVDEIAAEHVDADVVVHYGRSCLSPTARLPVIYVFTTRPLEIPEVIQAFEATFPSKEEKVVLVADITYNTHLPTLHTSLLAAGYTNLLTPPIIHDPSSQIPNRAVEASIDLKEYSLFHISDPPQALLLTLSSRVKEMFIYPTTHTTSNPSALKPNTTSTLRRRYALLTQLSTCAIFGILINTLSVTNYLPTITALRALISASGKKSYTFVVGKVNAAKIANFSEIGGWVVVGCWESSLIESAEFYRPIITPFELGLALKGDAERVWDGRWRGDFGGVEEVVSAAKEADVEGKGENGEAEMARDENEDSEEESAPPEFDLRTGRYVSHSRPMRTTLASPGSQTSSTEASKVLTRRAKGDLVTVNGTVSPGAEYLRNQRTWQGLGSDFAETEASQDIEEGRSGVARGYTVGEGGERT